MRLAVPVLLLATLAACGGRDVLGTEASRPATTPTQQGAAGRDQVLRVNLGSEPSSLDPPLAADIYAANVVINIMDPLVRLDSELGPTPGLAESWHVSPDGKKITFHLREDGRWTNGDPVTAADFEYSWKRALSPELAAPFAYLLFGVTGATEYNSCKPKERDCAALRDAVGVRALDDHTLEVTLTSPQPWFPLLGSHAALVAVHRPTVERYGKRWTDPANIVTNGPFRLVSWRHDDSITLERWDGWREAHKVALQKVDLRIIVDATTALSAFQAGEIDACFEQATCVPTAEIVRLRGTAEFAELPSLTTQYFGINVKTVPDVNERRALALALDRRALVANISRTGQPASTFTPQGTPGFDVIRQDFLPAAADLVRARKYMSRVKTPKRTFNLFTSTDELGRAMAIAVQAMWKELGVDVEVKSVEWAHYLALLGPPPDKTIDGYFIGFIPDFPDAFSFLEAWVCDGPYNATNFCDPAYDQLVAKARATPDEAARREIYAELEARLTGPNGAMPVIPLYSATQVVLHQANVTNWKPNRLGLIDLTKVHFSP